MDELSKEVYGILYENIKERFSLDEADVADLFGYTSKASFARTSARWSRIRALVRVVEMVDEWYKNDEDGE